MEDLLTEGFLTALATLLQAVAALLWPAFAFTVLFVFKKQIAELFLRLKRGKVLGQEIELDKSLDELQATAQNAQAEVAALPQAAWPVPPGSESDQEIIEQRIVSEAATSPKAALIGLAAELERLSFRILATTGHLRGRTHVPFGEAMADLDQVYSLPKHVPNSLRQFREVRNRLVHGKEGTDEEVLRAIDSGLLILRTLKALPREKNSVCETNVTVYSDAELRVPIEGVHGVVLETASPGGVSKSIRIFPSSRSHFRKGEPVAWEWDSSRSVGPAWYRDPATGEVKKAWHSSAEFIGRHLDGF